MPFTEDDLTLEENKKFKDLAAAGDTDALMDHVNALNCKYDGKPANFGDGVHRTCPTSGGKKRSHKRHRKSHKSHKSRKSRKSRKHKKTHKKKKRSHK